MAQTVLLPRHRIAPKSRIKALFQTGREKSFENESKIDRIAGDRDVMSPLKVVSERLVCGKYHIPINFFVPFSIRCIET